MLFTVDNGTAFDTFYSPHWSMALGIISSMFNILFFTPLYFAIAWYEKFGTNQNRTLINQLVSSVCWNAILQNCTILPLEIILNLFGPFSLKYCSFVQVIKNSLYLDMLILITFVTIVKYLYIFVLKNCAGNYTEIWCLLINIFSAGTEHTSVPDTAILCGIYLP